MTIEPFTIDIPAEPLDDLAERPRRTPFGPPLPVSRSLSAHTGTSLTPSALAGR